MADETRNLPAVPDAALEQIIYDGEFVNEARHPVPPRSRTVILSPRGRFLLRHAACVAAGCGEAGRRWHQARTRPERMMRMAEATGDAEMALKWAQLKVAAEREKRERREGRAESLVAIVKVFPLIAAIALGFMLTFGLLLWIGRRRFADMADPWLWAARAVQIAVEVASVAWVVAAVTIPVVTVIVLHRLGRTAGNALGWMAASADDVDLTINETAITLALQALRMPPITDYLKQGIPLPFIVPCRLEGRGTYAEIRIPKGATAEEIGKRRAKLASGLYRLPSEVWPHMGGDASHLCLWVADKGALAEGAGPYPLAEQGLTDVFRGLPLGKTLRGDPQRITVTGRNTIIGGMPDQGKSNGARVVTAGYVLDIITELRIYVPDINFDFEPFAPRCSRYVCGAEDEHIEQIAGDLEILKDELQKRGTLLQDYEEQEVTRALAHAGAGLHPVLWVLEEAHVAIQHAKHGKAISQLLCENVKLCRKRAVHMLVSTQAPVRGSMPPDVTRNCTNGIAFAVGDYYANDALLGQGAYAAGHRATELIPGDDRGTALCKGLSGQRSEVVQMYKLDVKRENDQVTPLVRRALAEMARRGRRLPGGGSLAITARDLLTDLAEVLRDAGGPVRLSDLPARLRRHAPSWTPYRSLTGLRLRELLDDEGVRTTNSGNVPRLDPEDLRLVLAERGELGGRGSPDMRPAEARAGGA